MKTMQNFLFAFGISLVLLMTACQSSSLESEGNVSDLVYSDEPLKKEFIIDSEQETELVYERTGTRLLVPANCFQFESGETVQGKVKIAYSEFNNPAEVFQSQLPMVYQDGNESFMLETNGMFTIRGESDGRPVTLKGEKEIKIEMLKENRLDNLNFFFFDEHSKKWQLLQSLDEDYRSVSNATPKPVNREQEDTNDLTELVPDMPEVESKDAYTFEIEVNKNNFPELKQFKGLKFEVIGSNFNSKLYQVKWDDILLSKRANGAYFVRLIKEEAVTEVDVKPVISQEEYAQAFALLEKQVNASRAKDKEIEQMIRQDNYNEQLRIAGVQNVSGNNFPANISFIQTASIGRMGTYNFDKPFQQMNIFTFNLQLTDESGKKQVVKEICAIPAGVNTTIRFSPNSVTLDTTLQHLIFASTDDNRILIAPASQTAMLNKKSKKQELICHEFTIEKGMAVIRNLTEGRSGG